MLLYLYQGRENWGKLEKISASELPHICRKLKEWQWRHNFSAWRHRLFFFLMLFFSLVKLSYWTKFYVNIITGSGVMTISFYEGLTRNPEIGNTPLWVLRNIWRLGCVRNTIFCTSLIKCYWICQGYSFYRFCFVRGKPTGLWLKRMLRKNKLLSQETE